MTPHMDTLDSLFADGNDDLILCPCCAGTGDTDCPRCEGARHVAVSSLTDDERFAAGLLPIDWDRPWSEDNRS